MSRIIKQAISLAAYSAAFEKFVTLLEHADGQNPSLLRVLTYHRVDEPGTRPSLDPGMISATPRSFEEQMGYLSTHYNVVSIVDVISAFETGKGKDLPPRAVLVTFDDAYCDFEEHAWPTLKRYEIPATLFVPTAYPNHPERTFWWDDLYQAIKNTSRKDGLKSPIGLLSLSNTSRYQTYKRLIRYLKTLRHVDTLSSVKQLCDDLGVRPTTNHVLDWDALRKLANAGVALGAHTRTHPLMNCIQLEDARDEAIGSIQDLEREIGLALPIFAYPGGEFNSEIAAMLEREGIKLAFTTRRGINKIHHVDPVRIRRINVSGRTTLPILRAQLLPWTVHFNRFQILING